MPTCKTTHRNDCWITRSAREADPEDKVNNSPNLRFLQAVILIFVFFLGEVIIMQLVFLKLMDSIFAAQNFKTFPSSSLLTDCNCSGSFEE